MNRDSVVIIPCLKGDAGLLQGPLKNSALTGGARSYFTEMFEVGSYVELIGFLITTAHSGTNPTLDVKFQWSPDKKTWIDEGDAFTQVTTTDSMTYKRVTANFGKYMRMRLDVGGTADPNYTLSLYIVAKG